MSVDSGMGNRAADDDLKAIGKVEEGEDFSFPGTNNVKSVIGKLKQRIAQDNPTNLEDNGLDNSTQHADLMKSPVAVGELEENGIDPNFNTPVEDIVPKRLNSKLHQASMDNPTATPPSVDAPTPATITPDAGVSSAGADAGSVPPPTVPASTIPTPTTQAGQSQMGTMPMPTASFNKIAWIIENGEPKCASCGEHYMPESEAHAKTAHCGFPGCADAEGKVDYNQEGPHTFVPNGNADDHFTLVAGKIEEGDVVDGDVVKTGDEEIRVAFNRLAHEGHAPPSCSECGKDLTDTTNAGQFPEGHKPVTGREMCLPCFLKKNPNATFGPGGFQGMMTEGSTRLASTEDYLEAFKKTATDSTLYYRGYEDAKSGKDMDEDLAELSDDYFHGYQQYTFYKVDNQQSAPQTLYDIKPNSNFTPREQLMQNDVDRGPNELTDGHAPATASVKESLQDPKAFGQQLEADEAAKRQQHRMTNQMLMQNMMFVNQNNEQQRSTEAVCKACDTLGNASQHHLHASIPNGPIAPGGTTPGGLILPNGTVPNSKPRGVVRQLADVGGLARGIGTEVAKEQAKMVPKQIATEIAGGGPEDPLADIAAGGEEAWAIGKGVAKGIAKSPGQALQVGRDVQQDIGAFKKRFMTPKVTTSSINLPTDVVSKFFGD